MDAYTGTRAWCVMAVLADRCPDCWHQPHLVQSCPVCWQIVHPTASGMIAPHWDSIGRDLCPGERLFYTRTIPSERQTGLKTA